jgi:hypothetical protein
MIYPSHLNDPASGFRGALNLKLEPLKKRINEMMNLKRERTRLSAYFVCLILILVWAVIQPRIAQAQWTSPDTSGNINTTGAGNVGIGTTTPAILGSNALGLHIKSSGVAGLRLDTLAGGGRAYELESIGNGNFGLYDLSAGSYRLYVLGNGNVGIGTTAPTRLMTLNAAATPYLSFNEGGAEKMVIGTESAAPYNRRFIIYDSTAAQYRLVIDNSGNIGIGTNTPQARLDVSGSVSVSGALLDTGYSKLRVSGGIVTPTIYDAYNVAALDAGLAGVYFNSSLNTTPNLNAFNFNAPALGATQKLASFKSGGVEKASIDKDGNLTIAGNINAKYQDVAEWVKSSQKLSVGTVVILDPERTNQVIASTESYDTRVAGVISERPGIALGEAGENKLLVATTGRVRVRVDASRAPVKIGDLLVTSDREGVAMKSVPANIGGVIFHRPGTIIGKALEPLEKGEGEIQVLLSLQ